jgi:hypothetical protein
MESPTALGILVLLVLLQMKHVVADGFLQTRWMLGSKGHYGSAGGLTHAGLHSAGSLLCLVSFGVPVTGVLVLAILDGVIHYHVDFAKTATVRLFRWTAQNTQYWWALAVDQLLHHLTYIAMAAAVVLWF